MNVIFLDFDGVINTFHDGSDEIKEKRIKILSEICKEYNCKVVIEASIKRTIDEETLESSEEWVNKIIKLFRKYEIDCIGITPSIGKKLSTSLETPIWKEDEIEQYLSQHPEIDHLCIIDDDDLAPRNSDLNRYKDYLVTPLFYSTNPEEEGLLEIHKNKVGEILKKKR